jgi:hypothetical protein
MRRSGDCQLHPLSAASFLLCVSPVIVHVFVAIAFVVLAAVAACAEPVRVRFTESLSHGFLVLRNEAGDVLAHGELVQVPRGPRIENRLTFRFKDGSLWEETLTFTQQKVFRLITYRQVQRGPSFPTPSDVSFDRENGRYRAQVGDESAVDGSVDVPEDVHNGLTSTLMKNLPPGGTAAGRLLVFTPKPQLLDTELRAEGEDRYFVGEAPRSATRFLLKMEPRGVSKIVASILGKDPPEVRYWIAGGTAPAFVRFEGPVFLKGPRWRIELGAPRWPER